MNNEKSRDGQESVHVPDWTTGNEHDPGVTIVALFAFLGTGLLWHSSGRQHGVGLRLYRMIGVGLAAAGAMLLLRPRRRRGRPRKVVRGSQESGGKPDRPDLETPRLA